jgi:hypothetical protein
MNTIIAKWEKRTGLNTEETTYRALHSRDVNNYIAITKDGNKYKWGLCGNDGLPYGTGWKWDEFTNTLSEALAKYIAQRLGQKAWDDNVFVWLYKIKKQ